MQQLLFQRQQFLQHLMRALDAVSPLNILDRGYAILQKGNDIIREAAQVKKGDEIKAKIYRGQFLCTIKEILENC